MDNLAVFDLDGTLWRENSHTDILNKYYHFKISDNLIMKVFRNIFPNTYMSLLNRLFNRIPDGFVNDYRPKFKKAVQKIMKEYQSKSYKIVIISNAPKRIINRAAERLSVNGIQAPISEKNKIVSAMEYKRLAVISDNITDYNLMLLADEVHVVVNQHNSKFFEQNRLETMKFILAD
jgi:phosphoserine phosphatase